MKIIVLLICLGVQRFLNIQFSLPQFDWFKLYRDLIKSFLPANLQQGIVGLLITVLPVAIIVWLLGMLLGGVMIAYLILSVVVMFVCLDGRDLGAQMKAYMSGDASGQAEADALASKITGDATPADGPAKARAITNAIFFQGLHHVFGVVFWYLILGLFGAITYFLVHYIASNAKKADSDLAPLGESANMVQAILDWIPVRLLGLSFAIVGSSGDVIKQVTKNLVGALSKESRLAEVFGLAALKADSDKPETANLEENKSALGLVFMATGVWLAIVLVIAIISFI